MRGKRTILAVCLLLLCGLGWGTQVLGFLSARSQFAQNVEQGNQYVQTKLYQKAIQSYETALKIREDAHARTLLLDAYAAGVKENVLSRSDYTKALETACTVSPKQISYWERLLRVLCDDQNYKAARNHLRKVVDAGLKSEVLDALRIETLYSFTSSRTTYLEIYPAANGYTTIYNGSGWGVMGPDGERLYECDYEYISPFNENSDAVFKTTAATRLKDKKGVVQANLEQNVQKARAVGNGLLPVYADEQWKYLDCEGGQYLPGSYDEASSFQNGMALVKKNGAWQRIDTTGNRLGETELTDVKLYGNGAYSFGGLMVAAAKGDFALYRADGTLANEFAARDMDLYMGGYVAYQDRNGLWGYVNKNGQVVIEPQFKQAKSFSNGLAGVYNGESWGFINAAGEVVIEYQFVDVDYFTAEGVCFVSSMVDQSNLITLRFPEDV